MQLGLRYSTLMMGLTSRLVGSHLVILLLIGTRTGLAMLCTGLHRFGGKLCYFNALWIFILYLSLATDIDYQVGS
jgi:hypothetical protein